MRDARASLGSLLLSLVVVVSAAVPPVPAATTGQPIDPLSPYRIGPHDEIELSVYEDDSLSGKFRVSDSGFVSLPLLGRFQVVNMTLEGVAEELTRRLNEGFIKNPTVAVGVSDYRSKSVNIIGEVTEPGQHFLKGPTTLIDILTAAGGGTENAGSHIAISRKVIHRDGAAGSQKIVIPYHALFSLDEETYNQYNIYLRPDDVVFVGKAAQVYVTGEVRDPGAFKLTPGLTVSQAIVLAGGINDYGRKGGVEIVRRDGTSVQNVKVDLRKIERGKIEDVILEEGDKIIVHRRRL